ncbi:MAG TPA: hypothetical protein VJU18_08995 [Vicinamibacteria bacterium]|nr:hypothetical protein [Vicinamibacteria bacterium]
MPESVVPELVELGAELLDLGLKPLFHLGHVAVCPRQVGLADHLGSDLLEAPGHLGSDLLEAPGHLGSDLIEAPGHLGSDLLEAPGHLGPDLIETRGHLAPDLRQTGLKTVEIRADRLRVEGP